MESSCVLHWAKIGVRRASSTEQEKETAREGKEGSWRYLKRKTAGR